MKKRKSDDGKNNISNIFIYFFNISNSSFINIEDELKSERKDVFTNHYRMFDIEFNLDYFISHRHRRILCHRLYMKSRKSCNMTETFQIRKFFLMCELS